MDNKVVCQLCKQTFTDVISPTQGVQRTKGGAIACACAASVYKLLSGAWVIVGHYPSDYDLDLLEFKSTPIPALQWADPVCDACIESMLKPGWLKKVRELNLCELSDNTLGIDWMAKLKA